MSNDTCAFCSLPESRILLRNKHGFWIKDGFPVTRGHSLIISTRHVGSWFELSLTEQSGLMVLLAEARTVIETSEQPAGFNIGINDGAAAGQTVPHLHIHLMPRYPGDQPDPRGGVRWIFPDKADYWSGR